MLEQVAKAQAEHMPLMTIGAIKGWIARTCDCPVRVEDKSVGGINAIVFTTPAKAEAEDMAVISWNGWRVVAVRHGVL